MKQQQRIEGRWNEGTGNDAEAQGQGHRRGVFDSNAPRAAGSDPTGAGAWDRSPVLGAPTQRERPSFRGRGPKEEPSDEQLRERVCDALMWDVAVDACDIEVSVKDREVTLSGSVPDRFMRRRAEEIAENCRGVRQVINLIRRRQPSDDLQGDRV
jgi:hypothetical protein